MPQQCSAPRQTVTYVMRSRGSACTELACVRKFRSRSFTLSSTPPGSAWQGWQLARTCPGPHPCAVRMLQLLNDYTGRHPETLDPTLCMWQAGAHEAGGPGVMGGLAGALPRWHPSCRYAHHVAETGGNHALSGLASPDLCKTRHVSMRRSHACEGAHEAGSVGAVRGEAGARGRVPHAHVAVARQRRQQPRPRGARRQVYHLLGVT